jgi:hypothetical protein
MKSLLYTLIVAIYIISCASDPATEPKPQTIDPTAAADTNVKHREHFDGSEINDYSGLPMDTMRIKYGSEIDTLYGYRNNNLLMIEGDIKIPLPTQGQPFGKKGIGTTANLWPKNSGRLIIPYKIRADYKYSDRVKTALKMWQDGLPNIKFVEQSFETDYILFVPSKYTQSFIGKIGDSQTIELEDEAMAGNVAHELGHALGLYHEHSREDRNRYVIISCPNDVNYAHAYKTDPYASDIGVYNYNSIMHYPQTKCLEFPANLPENATPGQRLRITKGDFDAIKRIYRFQ